MKNKFRDIFKSIDYVRKLLFKYKKRYLIILVILNIISVIFPFLSLFNVQYIINSLQEKENFNQIINCLILYIILGMLNIAINKIYAYFLYKYQEYLYLNLNQMILNKTKDFELSDYENPQIYDLIQRAEQNIGIRPFSMVNSFLVIMKSILTLLTSISILLLWHWWLIFPFIVLSIIAIKYFAKIGNQEYEMIFNRTNYERKSWYIAHLLTKDTFVKEVKMLDLSDYLLNKFYSLRSQFYKENIRMNKIKTLFSFFYNLSNFSISAGIVVLAAIESYLNHILVGNLMTYINVVSKIENSIENIVNSIFAFYQDSLYIENINNYLNYYHNYEINDYIDFNEKIEKIEFINVSYKYPGQKEYALKNINLILKRDEITVLVGENGSGKTTLIKLLNGLYDNYEGEILFNNVNIRIINKKSIRNKISTLFQDYNQYQFTVKENIGFGNINKINSNESIYEAAQMANTDKFINKLKNKYNQQLGTWFKEGIQLSGGQWQKIAIARLYMNGGDVYVLDEPTASLDPKSEYEFFSQLKKNKNDKVSLFITHRFINANVSDKIIVMDKGRIVERGNHNDLIRIDGIYKKMYDFQCRKR
ncbi:MAG: ABC transporter ATP-binding protein [Faecalibacillus intestinalis]|uniref:ABC transporter ATP-binding protein n=1 Tax=Faecalibacillus intestinalis TaxID=1982626 RepID=UPI003992BC12